MPRVLTHLAVVAQLALFGVIGFPVLSFLLWLFTGGVAAIPVLGLGLILIALGALAMFGIARFERARVRGLFGFDLPSIPMRASTRSDGWRVPQTLALQIIDVDNLKAVLHVLIVSVLGTVALVAIWGFGFGAAAAFSPVTGFGPDGGAGVVPAWGWTLIGIALVALALAVLIGLSVAHRAISAQLLVPSREAELARQAHEASAQREGAVRAADVERTRIERDLHDGVQPRLVSIAMTLGLAREKLTSAPTEAAALIDEAHASTKLAVTELRQLARGIHTSVLDDRGLDAALSAIAARSHVPVQLDVQLTRRCARAAETAVYFSVAEALTNAAKHARASGVRVTIRERADGLWARIEDDGVGGANRVPGGGIDGIANRVLAAGGTFSIDSPAGGPTALEVTVPCAL